MPMSSDVYGKILVPYDGSKHSCKALDHAIAIAKAGKSRSEVVLLHVVSAYPDYHFVERPARSIRTGEKTTLSRYLVEVNEFMKQNAEDALAKEKEETRLSSNFEIKTAALSGPIAQTIFEYATRHKVDLIVIGSIGRSGLSKLRTLGSVSRSVSERAPCPVMIVH